MGHSKMSLFNHSFPVWHLYLPAMTRRRPTPDFLDQQRQRLSRCWDAECDIDPLIVRLRQLHGKGQWLHARGIEQEVQPIFWN